MPLPVTEDTPPDMLAGAMDITVLLPNGRTVNMSVERSTPMMDLLVQLTTVHKLSLAGHTTVALSDSGYPLHHLPSTPLGALDTRLIQVAQRTNTLKRAPARPNNVQPFTTTFRLQVHLPRNQLFVTRVSPDTKLSDVLHLACSEKNLDPSKYELRHPANLCECLSLSHTLADYRLQEVTLVASRPPGAPLTPADIMALQREEEKRRQQVKKTGGIYNIIFNKRSKSTPEGTGSVSSDSLNGRSISPARSDESIERSVSPPAPAPPQRPGRKRRPAPKPPVPGPTPTAVTQLQNGNKDTGIENNKESSTTLSHSRTSSDSSGYHEASVLSESPDTRTNSSAETLPRRSKLPSTTHIVAKNKSSTLQHGASKGSKHNLSQSLSNLTAVGINAQNKHSVSTTSLASQGLMPRKKKAAPPPPVVPVKKSDTPELVENNTVIQKEVSKPTEVVAALLHDIKTFDEKEALKNRDNLCVTKKAPDADKNFSKPIQAVPKLDDILDEEDIVLDLTTTKRNSVPKLESVKQTSTESTQSSIEERSPSVDVDPCRVETPLAPAASPDLVTSAIIHPPPPATQDEDELLLVGIPPTVEAVLRDETTTPEVEEVSDWQYHLPAPPSAFRDLHSPTITEFGTVVLADANVFQEAPVDIKPNENCRKSSTSDHVDKSPSNLSQENNLTKVDGISQASGSTTSLLNGHSSLSSRSSLDSNQEAPKPTCAVIKNTSAGLESDWEPQTIVAAESVTRTKPALINGDLRLRQDGLKEVYKVNPIFNNEHFQEDVAKEETTSTKVQLEETDSYRIKNSVTRGSNSDLQLSRDSSQLKNFTISTYTKPTHTENIFDEETDGVFKKPLAPAKFVPVVRTNSYSMTDKDRPAPSVKRSTSYISLARPYTKPSTFQSISRTKSISSLVKEEEADSSEEDVTQPAAETREELSETSTPSPPPPPPPQETKPVEVPKSEPRPFVYRGPPAINFSTWSERPKVQVSLKSDRDYRMGNHSSSTNVNSFSQSNPQQTSKETSYLTRNNKINNGSVAASVNKSLTKSKPTTVKNAEETSTKIEPTPLTMRIVSHKSSNHRNRASLTEEADQSFRVSNLEKTSKIDFQQADRLPIVRAVELKKTHPESFVQLRNSTTTHLNGPSNNNVANVPVNYQQANLYNRHSYIEPGQVMTNGNSSLTKSISTSQINIETPDKSFSQTKILANGAKKYTSVVGINGSGAGSDKIIQHSGVQSVQTSNQVPVQKPLGIRQNFSTVKVNGFGGGKPMPIVKGFRMAGTEAANYDHGVGNTLHFQASKTNITNGIHKGSTSTKQPLKTINGIENLRTKSSSNHATYGSKVERNSSIVRDQTDGKVVNNIPEPPKPPTMSFKKPTQRPVSNFTNPRDELMDAIKNFGGRESLKPAKPKTNTNVILSI